MEKITEITPEQKAEIPNYIKKWVDLASTPIDRDKALKLSKEIFKKN